MESIAMVVPVRFSGGGLSMQTTTSRIGAQGVFIRCVIVPKQGASVQVELTLPGAARPFVAAGTVQERVQPGTKGKDPGFWLRFDALPDESRTTLNLLLRG